MPYRKGELTKAAKLRDWPHHVTIPIAGGLGQRLNAMHAFCQGMTYQTIAERGPPELAIWCFKRKEDADAFRARFGSISV